MTLALFYNQVVTALRLLIKAMKEVNGRNNGAKILNIKPKTFLDTKFVNFVIKELGCQKLSLLVTKSVISVMYISSD